MATQVIKIHENVLPGAHCQENLRLLSETSLRVNLSWNFMPSILLKFV